MKTTSVNAVRPLWPRGLVDGYASHTEVDSKGTPAPAQREQAVAVDPVTHPNWDSLVAALPDSSFFHGSAWARVLLAHQKEGRYGAHVLIHRCHAAMLPEDRTNYDHKSGF